MPCGDNLLLISSYCKAGGDARKDMLKKGTYFMVIEANVCLIFNDHHSTIILEAKSKSEE